jgi:hypothetical protein
MVNVERLKQIAKPRDKKAHRKMELRYKYRWLIRLYQDIYLYIHAVYRAIKG